MGITYRGGNQRRDTGTLKSTTKSSLSLSLDTNEVAVVSLRFIELPAVVRYGHCCP